MRMFELLCTLCVVVIVIGCNRKKSGSDCTATTLLVFQSGRALDGSDTANGFNNIWSSSLDGALAAPITHLTAANSSAVAVDGNTKKIAFISDRSLDGSDSQSSN